MKVSILDKYIRPILLYSGMYIILFIFYNILLASIGFLFNVSIQFIYPLISTIFSEITILFLNFKKHNNILVNCTSSAFIFVCIFLGSLIFCSNSFDFSYDGSTYHKMTVGALKEGWNPVYEDYGTFMNNSSAIDLIDSASDIDKLCVNTYPKAMKIFGACIYKLTGNIECAKCYNFLSLASAFLIVLSIMIKKKRIIFSIVFSALISASPVVIPQIKMFYIDGCVYLYFMLLLFLLVYRHKEEKEYALEQNILYFILLIFLLNIKTTSFVYAGVYCFGIYLIDIYLLKKQKIEKKEFLTFTYISIIAVLVGVLIVGASVYVKNFIKYKNSFYPAVGYTTDLDYEFNNKHVNLKGNILDKNEPIVFKNKNNIQKYFMSLFGQSTTVYESEFYKAKWPFTFTKGEILQNSRPDIRIGGNGIFYSGIFVLSVVFIIIGMFIIRKDNSILFNIVLIYLIITALLICFVDVSWWTRFFPQTYLISMLGIYFAGNYFKKLFKFIIYPLAILLVVDLYYLYTGVNDSILIEPYSVDVSYFNIQNDGYTAQINTNVFVGIAYDFYDIYKDKVDKVIVNNNVMIDDNCYYELQGHLFYCIIDNEKESEK